MLAHGAGAGSRPLDGGAGGGPRGRRPRRADRRGARAGRRARPSAPCPAGTLAAWAFDVTPGPDAEPSRPYYLPAPVAAADPAGASRRPFDPLRDTLYDWPAVRDATLLGEPFGPPPLVARFHLEIGNQQVVVDREVVERLADQAVGEVRRPLRIVPALEVSVEPDLVVWSASWNGSQVVGHAEPPRAKVLKVALRSHVDRPLAGTVRLEVPEGWPEVAAKPFSIEQPYGDDAVEIPFQPPAGLERGHYRFEVAADVAAPEAEAGGTTATYRASYPLIDYPHIRATPSPKEARVEVAAADIRLPKLSAVGFVVGASDKVPQDLAAIGVPIETLTGADVAAREPADLARYDAIVVGSRAYETDAELGRVNAKLLDYARGGGLLIVLYQQYQFVRGDYAPYPLEIARPHDRVTDETAPVRLLEPESPVFTTPNRLGPEDWEGWVQERGLYFAHTWDAHYMPLLQFPSDPALAGEGRGGGGEAAASRACAAACWWRLWATAPTSTPASPSSASSRPGVTGAYRLFANLLGLNRGARGAAGPGDRARAGG